MGADEVLGRLLAAIEAGDVEGARAAYHPEAVIWHSNDGVEQTVDDNIKTLDWITRNLPGIRYTNVRRYCFPGGVIEQHDTEIPVKGSDQPMQIAACLVVLVDDDGRITRLDEYIDSASVAALVAAAR